MEYGDQASLCEQLRHNIERGSKPIAFIVGSGLTCGSVPGVQWYVDKMHSDFTGEALDRFNEKVAGLTPAESYQQAAEFAKMNRSQDWLNRLIRLGVLHALPGFEQLPRNMIRELLDDDRVLKRIERDPSYWLLGDGVKALGCILGTKIEEDRRGPVVTTNFDPLVEVAVRSAGHNVSTQWLGSDDRITHSDAGDAVEIAHVHGFYRNTTTLNTQSQLTRPRVRLGGSIRERLRGHYVLVCGYGGWQDCFTRALLERIAEDDDLDMEISWGWHGPSPTEERIATELHNFDAISQFSGIDVNTLFPKVNQTL